MQAQWLKEILISILLLAFMLAVCGYLLYRYLPAFQTKQQQQPKDEEDIYERFLLHLKNPQTSLEVLTQETNIFIQKFAIQPIEEKQCAHILSLALAHKHINGSLILRLEKIFKEHFKEDAKLFEALVIDALKKR